MKKENIVLGGSIFAALGASLCCVGPVLFALLGLGAFGASSVFTSLRPYLLAVAVLAIAFGFYRAYFRREACAPGEACATGSVSKASRALLWVAAVSVLAFALSPYGSGANSVNKAARAEVVSRSHFTPRALLPRPVAPLLPLG